jgi:hypothetical protein
MFRTKGIEDFIIQRYVDEKSQRTDFVDLQIYSAFLDIFCAFLWSHFRMSFDQYHTEIHDELLCFLGIGSNFYKKNSDPIPKWYLLNQHVL